MSAGASTRRPAWLRLAWVLVPLAVVPTVAACGSGGSQQAAGSRDSTTSTNPPSTGPGAASAAGGTSTSSPGVPAGRLAPASEAPATGERFDVLARAGGTTVEHILSSATPEPGVYDQDHDEWVVLLEGGATLRIEGATLELGPGDHVLLPAHVRHEVVRTEPGTRWLAVHFAPGEQAVVPAPAPATTETTAARP